MLPNTDLFSSMVKCLIKSHHPADKQENKKKTLNFWGYIRKIIFYDDFSHFISAANLIIWLFGFQQAFA